jgi:hypothetical protein
MLFKSKGALHLSLLVLVVLAMGTSAAGAAALITGADVKDNSLAGEDIADGRLGSADYKDGSVKSADVKDGSIGAVDLNAEVLGSVGFAGPNWGIVDRNVIGGGDSYLRAGPSVQLGQQLVQPPMGVGSLGINTGSGADKAAFGNQVDFSGDLFSALTTVSYSVFTTGENISQAPGQANMPSITFEIDPNLSTVANEFSSMVFVPANSSAPGVWRNIVATDDAAGAVWGLTGADMPCNINGVRCTWTELQAALNDGGEEATIATVQLTKGRDFAFSGAVDALQINNEVFDFEPTGVVTTTPAP